MLMNNLSTFGAFGAPHWVEPVMSRLTRLSEMNAIFYRLLQS